MSFFLIAWLGLLFSDIRLDSNKQELFVKLSTCTDWKLGERELKDEGKKRDREREAEMA
jgi:hypothetical protein